VKPVLIIAIVVCILISYVAISSIIQIQNDFGNSVISEDKTPAKYEGLTQNQITKVRIIEDTCKNEAEMVYLEAGAAVEEIFSKKCNEGISKMIQGFQKNNSP